MLMSSWRLKKGALRGRELEDGGKMRNEVVGSSLLSHPHSWEFQLRVLISLRVWISRILDQWEGRVNFTFQEPRTPYLRAGLRIEGCERECRIPAGLPHLSF